MNNHLIFLFLLILQAVFAFPKSIEKNPKVVGGRDANEHEAPYIVSLQFGRLELDNFRHVCGGSIITLNSVLSAAHCITEVGFEFDYQIVAGQHDLANESGNEQIRPVGQYFIHEQFQSGPVVGPFDIMILRLNSDLLVVPGIVEMINLPSSNEITSGDATLFGWGSTSDTTTPSFPDILQTVTKPIIQWDLCREIVNTVMAHEPLHSTNLCTGPLDSNPSACNGDSGGPLIQQNGNSLNVIGIVSWGSHFPCGSLNSVSVYVRTSAFIDWINERIQ